jgi:hypothetical protein
MATAVCIKCGNKKASPLAFCPHCGFIPKDLHDQARSILLSDAHRTSVELAAAATDIRHRQILIFEPSELQPVLDTLNDDRAARGLLGVRKSTWLMIGITVVAGVLVAAVTILIQLW